MWIGKGPKFVQHRHVPELVPEYRRQVSADKDLYSLQRIARRAHRGLDVRQKLLQRRHADLMEKVFLAGHVIVERGLLYSQSSGNLARGGRGVSLLIEKRRGNIE